MKQEVAFAMFILPVTPIFTPRRALVPAILRRLLFLNPFLFSGTTFNFTYPEVHHPAVFEWY